MAFVGFDVKFEFFSSSSFVSPDKENMLSGIFFENFFANELIAQGINLFYQEGKRIS